ncbi:MAG: phosphohydrolase, partial [Deltaproteobacteria bacterium]
SAMEGHGLLVKAPAYMAVTTGLELVAGTAALRFLGLRLWDYSDQRLNYRGIICLKFSIYWMLLAFAFERFILPPYMELAAMIPPAVAHIAAIAIPSIMAMDLLAVFIKRFMSMASGQKTDADARFAETARPILNLPAVKKLEDFNHHRGKTRLAHVTEVAYISFLVGQKLSLDCDAIIKGALLHDLFYYDWLREGPRLHGFRHHRIALENARKTTSLSKKEEDIIKKHMWPLTVIPPRYMESLVVSVVDTFCSTRDYLTGIKKQKHGKNASGENRI